MRSMSYPEADERLLNWGGLAGLLGGALMLFVFLFVGVVVGPDPSGLAGPVTRFPEIMAARTVENTLYLVAIALWALQVGTLSRVLGGTRRAPAFAGGILGIAGLTVLAAGALPHIATSRLAGLYHAAGATPQDQATIVLLWQANQGIFDALLATGLVLLPTGVVALGVAMLRAPGFGRVSGGATVTLGVIALAAASVFVLDPTSPIVALAFLALIVFSLAMGWKIRRRSTAPDSAPAHFARLTAAEGSRTS